MEDDSTVGFSVDLPMPTLMDFARQIGRSKRAVVVGSKYCRFFDDGVGSVCVDLENKFLLLTTSSN